MNWSECPYTNVSCAARSRATPGADVRSRSGGNSPPHRIRRSTWAFPSAVQRRSEEHTSELQSRRDLVCRLLLEKKKKNKKHIQHKKKKKKKKTQYKQKQRK